MALCALALAWSAPVLAKPERVNAEIIVLKNPALKHKKKHATATAATKPAAKSDKAAKTATTESAAAKTTTAEKPHPAPPIVVDMTKAMPLDQAAKLPSTQEQFDTLNNKIEKAKPNVAAAKEKSEQLAAETARLQHRLIATAARVQYLESEKLRLDADILKLTAEEASLSQGFEHDRAQVARLLAVLERLQHDMPPVVAIKSDDALGAARGAMLLGASLPRVYGAAAELGRRLETLRVTRATLIVRRTEGAKNAYQLEMARRDLDQLLAIKQEEAQSAAGTYGVMQAELDRIAIQAGDLETLMNRVAALRAGPKSADPSQTMVVVSAAGTPEESLKRGSLLRPVAGMMTRGGLEGVGGPSAPGVSFTGTPGATVIAPADSRVLFAGPYHKNDRVLILEMSGGYDLVLAGLERIDVRSGDRLLAGEPLGLLPRNSQVPRLYFELRQNGKGVSPAPWLEVDLRKAKRT